MLFDENALNIVFKIHGGEIVAAFSYFPKTYKSNFNHVIGDLDLLVNETYPHDYIYLSCDGAGEYYTDYEPDDERQLIFVQLCKGE